MTVFICFILENINSNKYTFDIHSLIKRSYENTYNYTLYIIDICYYYITDIFRRFKVQIIIVSS